MNAVRAVVGFSLMMFSMTLGPAAQMAQAGDKVIAGSLGGQAPLWAIYVAVHKSFFAAEGIDLELNFAQSGAAVTQQLTAASLDVALSVGITDPIRAIDKGASLAGAIMLELTRDQVRLAPAYKRGEPLVVVSPASVGARAARSREAAAPER